MLGTRRDENTAVMTTAPWYWQKHVQWSSVTNCVKEVRMFPVEGHGESGLRGKRHRQWRLWQPMYTHLDAVVVPYCLLRDVVRHLLRLSWILLGRWTRGGCLGGDSGCLLCTWTDSQLPVDQTCSQAR